MALFANGKAYCLSPQSFTFGIFFFTVENKQKLTHIMQKDSFRSGVLESDSLYR